MIDLLIFGFHYTITYFVRSYGCVNNVYQSLAFAIEGP